MIMSKIPKRITARIKRALRNFGYFGFDGEFKHLSRNENSGIKLLIIAPGAMEIPTQGWGAVETIIAETLDIYIQEDYRVSLLNSMNVKHWLEARKFEFDVILCHSDVHAKKALRSWQSVPVVAVTHYGLAAYPDLWHRSYRKTFESIARCDVIICLNPQIEKTFRGLGIEARLITSPNGSAFSPKVASLRRHNEFVILGKVEDRKQQFEIYQMSKNTDAKFIFVGEIVDDRVKDLISSDASISSVFVGEWNRSQLRQGLSELGCLVLMSKGEADALVLYEAQLAGLPIIVTPSALGSQNPDLPWIKVLDEVFEIEEILRSSKSINSSPSEIADFADMNYRWKERNTPLMGILKEFSFSEGQKKFSDFKDGL